MSTKREIPNVSYTNKDFNSIYIELLEYAKKLSYRWDPTVSDESDPGVVLLKLAALIGDKNNYNIDKNVLELMPNSVTQLSCARQLFSQCGYTMSYYNSAVGNVNITVNSSVDPEDDSENPNNFTYTLPRFTMLSDTNNSVVYTTTEEKTLYYNSSDTIEVIEGTVSDYTINGDALITTANLDNNNRIYFTESDIAENGIFITNVDSTRSKFSNYEEWYKVDTLETEPPLSTCYRFGLSLDGSLCYIQFPDDVELLFGEGVNIKYIRTKGSSGNISANFLKQFYVDTEVIKKSIVTAEEKQAAVSNDNVHITNILPILNGSDPETIDEAYRSYRRVKTTFDTLVSLKDYTDNLVTSNSASNGFVCDRTNDIQRAYRILEKQSAGVQYNNIVENVEEVYADKFNPAVKITMDKPSMTAFDLCVYALEYIPTADTYDLLKKSFQLSNKRTYENKLKKGTQKSLQHDFLQFEEDKILLVKNKYPILCTIIPRYELTTTEKFEVQYNIETALCKALNSNELDFSEAIKFDTLRNTILNSDDRIKHIEGLETPTYSTWVTYLHNGVFKEMHIDTTSFSGGFEEKLFKDKIDFTNVLATTDLYYFDTKEEDMISVAKDSAYDKSVTYYTYDAYLNDLWMTFRAEIYAKNILCGTTPLYISDSVFVYGFNQSNTEEHSLITKVTTNTDIKLSYAEGTKSEIVSPELEENENILLTAPNFVEENVYSTQVKMIYSLSDAVDSADVITPNSKFALKGNNFIVFFWKASDSETSYTYMKYDSSINSPANFISPSYELPRVQNSTLVSSIRNNDGTIKFFSDLKPGKGVLTGDIALGSDNLTPNQFVKKLTHNDLNEVLTGTQTVKTLAVNKIHINNDKNGSSDIYWILNDIILKDGKQYYRLFDEGIGDTQKYTLQSGEYLMYTNSAKSVLYMLGEGTLIERNGWTNAWDAPVITYTELISEGIDLLTDNNCWYQIRQNDTSGPSLYATEMQHHQIGPGNRLHLSVKSGEVQELILNNELGSLKQFDRISYTDSIGTSTVVENIDSDLFSWEACSILNINVGPDKPQKLSKHQNVILYSDSSVIDLRDTYTDEENITILCSNYVNKVGGKLLSVVYNEEPSDFMCYTDPKYHDDGHSHFVYDNNDLSMFVRFNQMEENLLVPTFKSLKGTYLIQLNPPKDLELLKIFKNPEDTGPYTISSLIPDAEEDIGVVKLYKLDVQEDSDISIVIQTKPGKDSATLTAGWEVKIKPLFRYSSKILNNITTYSIEEQYKTIFETQLLAMLKKLDPDSIYDYANTDTYIDNPLVSSSFLNSKHFYNPFTICEWDVDKSITEDIVVYKEMR